MTIKPGSKVWVPCEVRRGTFPDERVVRFESAMGSWGGILDVRQLREQIEEGRTEVIATVVESTPGRVCLQLPGQAERRRYLTGPEGIVENLRQV